MATKIWRPRALPVAQIQKLKFSGTITESSDVFVKINNKSIKVSSPDDTAAGLCEAVATRLTELRETIPELSEMTFTYVPSDDMADVTPHVLIQGVNPGQPWTITCESGTPSVDVDVTTEGVAGVDAAYSFYLTDNGTAVGGSFQVQWDLGSGDEFSLAIPWASPLNPETIRQALIGGMASLDDGDVTVTGTGVDDDPIVMTLAGAMAETAVSEPVIRTAGITGGGTATVSTIRNAASLSSACGAFLLHIDSIPRIVNIYIDTPAGSNSISYNLDGDTGPLPAAATIQSELELLVGAGNVSVTEIGSPTLETSNNRKQAYAWKFTGALAGAVGGISVSGGAGSTNYIFTNAGGTTQNEFSLVRVSGQATETFTLSVGGSPTAAIAINANMEITRGNIQTALASVQASGVVALGSATTGSSLITQWFAVTYNATTNLGDLTAAVGTCDAASATKIIDGGAATLTEVQSFWTNAIGGSTVISISGVGSTSAIALPATAATIKSALNAITTNDVDTVTGSGTQADPFYVTFTSATNYAQMTLTTANMATGAVTATVAEVAAGVSATSTVWSVVVNGTGGTVIYEFRGEQTSAIAYNASAGTLQTALQALTTIGSGQATVSGAGTSGSPYVITLGSNFAGEEVPQLIAYNESLTGTGEPTATFTTVQAATGPNHFDNADNWINPATGNAGLPANGDDLVFEFANEDMSVLYGLDQSSLTVNSIKSFRSMTGGIGLPKINLNGYPEYRRQFLRIGTQGSKTIDIGLGDGSGIQQFKADFGSSDAFVTIYQTGGSFDENTPCVCLAGTSANNTLKVYDGDVATAIEAGQQMTLASVVVAAGRLLTNAGTAIGSGGITVLPGAEWVSYNATVSGNIYRGA